MTPRRRQVFGWGALGLGALTLEGCGAGLLSEGGPPVTADEVEHLLLELDRTIVGLDALDPDPKELGIRGRSARVDQGRERCLELLRTLCFVGAYRRVPQEVWHEPRIAAHLARTLPRIQASIAAAHDHLGSMGDDEIAAIDKRFTNEPQLAMRIMERVDAYAQAIDVPIDQRTYLRMSTLQLAGRFRFEGTDLVKSKLTKKYDTLLARKISELGNDSSELAERESEPLQRSLPVPSMESQHLLGATVARPGTEGESCVGDVDCAEPLTCVESTCSMSRTPKSKQLLSTARAVAKVGAWLLLPPTCGISVLVLLVDLFMVIVAGIEYAGEE